LKKRKSLKGRRAKRAFLTQAYQRDAADFEVDIAREAIWGRQPEEAERALRDCEKITDTFITRVAEWCSSILRGMHPA